MTSARPLRDLRRRLRSSVASANLPSGTALAPGVLFRPSAVASAVAVALVVVSAALELGAAHWGIALVALPLLVGASSLARLAYPSLVRRTVVVLARSWSRSRSAASSRWSDDAAWATALHVAAAAVAFARGARRRRRQRFRGEAAPLASGRDYVTLTKPRIMSLLLLTGAAGCSSARRACRRSGCSP